MYYEFFGLASPPFKITPDPQLFYAGGNRGLALDALIYAIVHGEGIIKVVGEVGSGKTMLCRMLEHQLPKTVDIVYLANPSVSPDLILHAIAFEMSLPVDANTSRLEVMQVLQQALLDKHAQNRQVVVFVEEAQGMPLATLEEIRLLSNLETSRSKLLQIVLFGQPELDQSLAAPHIRQLRERITHAIYLEPLTREEIRHYLQFRMHAVGYRGPPVFSAAAVRYLQHYSCGLMRRINIFADKALLAAYADNEHYVQPRHIHLAAQDSGYKLKTTITWQRGVLLVGVILGLLFAVLWLSPVGQQWVTQQLTAYFSANANKAEPVPEQPAPIVQSPQKTNPPPVVSQTQTAQVVAVVPVVSEPAAEPEPVVADVNIVPVGELAEPLNARVLATQEWSQTIDPQAYVIQVLQTAGDKSADVARFLQREELQGLLPYLHVFYVNAQWNLVYGSFADESSAAMAMAALPPVLQRNRPYLRRLNGLLVTE